MKKEYEVIKSLVALSFFNYKLVDVAVQKLFFAFEMALKLKYIEITGVDWNKKRFKKGEKNPLLNGKQSGKRRNLETLIEELYALDVFEVSREFLHRARSIRNYKPFCTFFPKESYSIKARESLHSCLQNILYLLL